jgi:hypothetical protein
MESASVGTPLKPGDWKSGKQAAKAPEEQSWTPPSACSCGPKSGLRERIGVVDAALALEWACRPESLSSGEKRNVSSRGRVAKVSEKVAMEVSRCGDRLDIGAVQGRRQVPV